MAMIALTLAGCGGGTAEPATTDTTPETEAAPQPPEVVPPPKPWAEMTFDERKRHMGLHVLPVMTHLFKEYDPGEYSAFSCDTCHGDDAQDRQFAMPNPELPPLFATGSPEQQQMVQDHPEMVRFMFNHVLPAMREMVGAEPYDAETGTGFSCYACHPHGEDGAAPAATPEAPDAGSE